MKRCRRLLSRLILLSFALRALVPVGLMLQLPIASADESSYSASSLSTTITPTLGFVICPVQNPGLDLNLLVDRGQAHDQHAHHHTHHSDDSADSENQDHNTVSVDRGASLCNLWSSSADDVLLAADYSGIDLPVGLQPPLNPTVSIYQSNYFPSRLIRAPPLNL